MGLINDFLSKAKSVLSRKEVEEKATDTAVVAVGITAQLITAGSTSEFPNIVPLATKLAGLCTAIRDGFLYEKLIAFFKEIEDIPAHERKEIFQKLQSEDESFTKKIIQNLESIESTEKATALGKALRDVFLGKLDRKKYLRIQSISNHLDLDAIKEYKELASQIFEDKINGTIRKDIEEITIFEYEMVCKRLLALGIVYEEVEVPNQFGSSTPKYSYLPSVIGVYILHYFYIKD